MTSYKSVDFLTLISFIAASDLYTDYLHHSITFTEREMADSMAISGHLLSERFITTDQRESVLLPGKIQSERNHLLLNFIKGNNQAICCLFGALREEGQGHIVDHIIQHGKYDVDVNPVAMHPL